MGVGEEIAGGPIDDLVRFDVGEAGGLRFVGPDFDVLLELEEFLLRVEDRAAGGIGDGGLAGEGENLEGERERILQSLKLA